MMEEAEDSPFVRIPGGVRQFVPVAGTEKCNGDSPATSERVWYQRTATGSGVIYLFTKRPPKRVTSWYAKQAFGWVAEWPAQSIKLSASEGWCNFWSATSPEALQIECMNPHQSRVGAEHEYIEFTDNIDGLYLCGPENMRKLGLKTDHARQDQHWRTPAIVAPAVLVAHPLSLGKGLSLQHKENDMAGFDPFLAAQEQQARLAPSSKQGKSVSNIKQACGTALANVVENNKSAAVDAGYLTAGTIANNQFSKLASKHLPVLVRGYADTPLGKLVLANAAQMLIQHFKADNKTANRLTDAMMTSAMAEVIGSTGIEDLIDSFLSDPKIAKALSAVDAD